MLCRPRFTATLSTAVVETTPSPVAVVVAAIVCHFRGPWLRRGHLRPRLRLRRRPLGVEPGGRNRFEEDCMMKSLIQTIGPLHHLLQRLVVLLSSRHRGRVT